MHEHADETHIEKHKLTVEDKKLLKEAFREAGADFLKEVTAQFGVWSLRTVAAASVVGLIYFLLTINGWSHK